MTRRRRGKALRRRYGRANSHPLFPRLVVRLVRDIRGKVPVFTITGELQKHYGGAWHAIYTSAAYWDVSQARRNLRSCGQRLAAEHSVPLSHVEYVS